jgi:hypothetical protein
MSSRRTFLTQTAALGAAATSEFAFLQHLPMLSAQDVRNPRRVAAVPDDVEPLVRLIESSARDRVIEAVAERIRNGSTNYQHVLAALMLAGVRGIQPRPAVGFKFHAVLVVNSAHLASQAAADRDRWLPLFWSLDNFKGAQERNARESNDWRLAPPDDGNLPAPEFAARRLREGLEAWDEEASDRAAAQLVRRASLNDVYEILWHYGARDFRDIGHKAIYVANSYRTLQTIGWRHAEPIIRSLVYALLRRNAGNPADNNYDEDRHGRDNLRRLTRIRPDWSRGRTVAAATTDLLATLRTASAAEASDAIVANLNDRVDPQCLWDALFLFSGECLMRQPGIVGLHTMTTINALHFGFQTSSSDATRRFLLLQAAAFLPLFRAAMTGRGQVRDDIRIDTLEPAAVRDLPTVEMIFDDISRNRETAARKTLALLQGDRSQLSAIHAMARRLVFAKGTDSHDNKYSSAALEDGLHVSEPWRARFLASSVFWLKGSGDVDTPLLRRMRDAMRA